MSELAQVVDFENLNLNDIDPTFKPVEDGVYILKLLGLQWKEFAGKQESNQGQVYVSLNGKFGITNHPKHSGRKLYHNFFLGNNYELKALRRIMDATGVAQNPGETLKDWAGRISVEAPTFKAAVAQQQAKDFTTKQGRVDPLSGEPVMEAVINFRNVEIA
jgi:hypothetical protein